MKAVFVGGGSLRVLGIVRGALAEEGIFSGGEINLYDLDVARAEAMGRMIMKTPEYAKIQCKISWGTTLIEALDGADMVGVILMAGSARTFQYGAETCLRRGFIPSDNVSPNGAFLAIKGAPILMNIAKQMTRHCPRALLVDFANPIAVLSGMINNHTKIKAIGVCAGYTNHQWDMSRIFGKDEQGTQFDVETAGVNHLSFIVKGKTHGKDLFRALDRRIANDWKMPKLQSSWSKAFKRSIPRGIRRLIQIYQELGLLIFSTEGDGMMHLDYDEALRRNLAGYKPSTRSQLDRGIARNQRLRREADQHFRSFLDRDLPDTFWQNGWWQPGLDWAQRQDRDIFVEVMRGLSGVRKVKLVTTRPNEGAVLGFSDRTVLEYSQIMDKGRITPAGRYQVPAVAQGLIASLAAHQTMLGDALASNDPKMLAQALLSYPVRPFSKAAKDLYRELAKINREEMPVALRDVGDFFHV
jgi:alpha-galactosidase/6-phospho-beta-glucosidase family protein